MRLGLGEGWSANRAYREMQTEAQRLSDESGDEWTGVRRSVFLQMYSSTRVARGNVADAMNADKDIPAGGLDIPERPATVPSGYLNWGTAYTRPTGSSEIEVSFHPIRSTDPLTPGQVEELVMRQIEESAAQEHGTFARYTVEGVAFTGTQRLVKELPG